MRVGLALVAVTCACTAPPVDRTCVPTGIFGPVPDFGVARQDVTVEAFMPLSCPDEVALTATIAVTDPSNMPIEVSGTKVVRQVGRGLDATAVIHPSLAGRYHVAARFEPNLGTLQFDLTVVENLRGAPPEVVIADAGRELLDCTQLEPTQTGRLVCLSSPGRLFTRDGTLLDSLPGAAVRQGPFFWVSDSAGGVSRWAERPDGGFEMNPADTSVVPTGATGLLAPGPDDLLFAGSSGGLRRLWADDAGLHVAQLAEPSRAGVRALWRSGDRYVSLGEVRCLGTIGDGGACDVPFAFSVAAIGNVPGGMLLSTSDPAFSTTGGLALVVWSSTIIALPLAARWVPFEPSDVSWDTGGEIVGGAAMSMLVGAGTDGITLQLAPEGRVISITSAWVAVKDPLGRVLLYHR